MHAWMTGREVLALMADLAGVARPEITARIDALAERLPLGDGLGRRVAEMGAADRQWLAVGQALVGEPEVLLLDAPFTSLGSGDQDALRSVLAGLRGRTTIVIASREASDVHGICDRAAVLDAGRLVVESGLDSLLDAHPGAFVLEVATAGGPAVEALAARLRAEPWVSAVETEGASVRVAVSNAERAQRELLPAAVGSGLAVTGFRRERAELADIVAGARR